MKIISNCPLCTEHFLNVVSEKDKELMQCMYCGFASSSAYIIDSVLEENEEYKKLNEQTKQMVKINNNRFWVPGIITLPNAMIYPIIGKYSKEIKWACALMIDVKDSEKENYPHPDGGYYKSRYDTENSKVHDEFYIALAVLNKELEENELKTKLNLPKIKESDG